MSTTAIKIQIIGSDEQISKNLDDNVNPSMLISDLRRNWSDKFRVDIQSVRFNNQTLSDDNNFNFYKISPGSTVQLLSATSGGQINLFVEVQSQNSNQRSTQISVNSNIKTEELMNIIKTKLPFNFDSAYLTYHGQQLRSGISLIQQNVKNNDKIQVLMRTRGG